MQATGVSTVTSKPGKRSELTDCAAGAAAPSPLRISHIRRDFLAFFGPWRTDFAFGVFAEALPDPPAEPMSFSSSCSSPSSSLEADRSLESVPSREPDPP